MPVIDRYLGSHNRTDPLVGGEIADLSTTDHTPAEVTRAVWLTTQGDLKVTMKDGSVIVWPELAAGMWHPLRCTLIWKVGTTADGIALGW